MSEIHKTETLDSNNTISFDPDRRIEVNSSVLITEKYDPDKRLGSGKPEMSADAARQTGELTFAERMKNVDERNEREKDDIRKDDNGNIYRIGKELLPNSQYEINGYSYKTDDQGRIISAEGQLHIKDREGRLTIRDSIEDIGKGDQKETDDRGHLIGDQFDGSNGLENMVAQDANINRNDFKNLENDLAKEVKDGKEVYVKVEPIYEDDSKRPVAIVYTYSIDGDTNVRVFPND